MGALKRLLFTKQITDCANVVPSIFATFKAARGAPRKMLILSILHVGLVATRECASFPVQYKGHPFFLINSTIKEPNTVINPTKIIDSYNVDTGGRCIIYILIHIPNV